MTDELTVEQIVAKMAELADLDPIEIPPKIEYDRVMDTFLMGNDDAKDTAQINRNSGRETDNGEGMAGIDLSQPDPFAPEILPSLRPGVDF